MPLGHNFEYGRFHCTLHVFFFQIEEAAEHLARLPEDDGVKDGLATSSAISRSNAKELKPINKTAAIVTRIP